MIRENSKQIIKYLLNQVIACGDLNESICIHYKSLSNSLNLESDKYCRVCMQYLESLGCVHVIDSDENGNRQVCLTARGIDYLESN